MAYYTALIAFWALQTGTTAAKLATVNAATVTGSVPTVFSVSSSDIYSALDAGEWVGMQSDAVKSQLIRDILNLTNSIPVGAGTMANLILFYVFGSSPATLLNLGKLAVAQVQPWWQANGYSSPFSNNDLIAAGGLT